MSVNERDATNSMHVKLTAILTFQLVNPAHKYAYSFVFCYVFQITSVVVLEESPCPQGFSRTNLQLLQVLVLSQARIHRGVLGG